jgi:alanyl-tRNA synthetase
MSDLELDAPKLDSDELRQLEDAVVGEIRAARPVDCRYARMEQMEELGVRSRLLPEGHSGEIRLVEIEGVDLNTCGGTHVRNTAEIGSLALVGTETMRGGTRVFFVAGDRLRRRLVEHERRNLRLRTLLDTGDDELPQVVELRLQREKELARERRRLEIELAELTADQLASSGDQPISGHWADRDLGFLQEIGKALVQRSPGIVALLTAGQDREGSFLLVADEGSGLELGDAGAELSAILAGRGGGRAPFFQGRATALGRRDEAVTALRRMLGVEKNHML